MHIRYSIAESNVGKLLVASTDRGICSVQFGESEQHLEASLRAEFTAAEISEQPPGEAIAALLRHGLLRGRCIPSKPQRQFRERTRSRSTLVQDHARTLKRLQAVLEDANLKLASVVTASAGVSARAMLEAILAGERAVETWAD